MQFSENVLLAINGLRANKMRALLTMLGIIIGISSVITIVTLGNAMTNSVSSLLNDMGANSIQIQIMAKPDEYGDYNWNRTPVKEDYITNEMMKQYMDSFSGSIDAYGVSEGVGPGTAMNGRNQAKGAVQGINANALGLQSIDIIAGHDLTELEVSGAKSVVVLSDSFVKSLFPGIAMQQAIGREVRMRVLGNMYTYTIVGVYHYEVTGFASNITGDVSTNFFIPITLAKPMVNKADEGYTYLLVKASGSVTDTKLFAKQSEDFFNSHFYRGNKYVKIGASSMDSMIGQMTSMMGTMSLAISVIAAISLLVGGIGVMNIMLVSVTERTREIGTRKALGARNSAIRIQFIVESMIICLIGGIIGVILGTAMGRLGSVLLHEPSWPTLSIVLIAVSFSMAIGVFFGYYPANKAARLDPIEALRYE